MLDQMVESKSNERETARRGSFLMATFGVMVAVLVSGWTYSLFAKGYGIGNGDFDMATLVAPVTLAAEVPAPKVVPERRDSVENSKSTQVTVKEFYYDLGEGDPPKDMLGVKNVIPVSKFPDAIKGDRDYVPDATGRTGETTDRGCGLCDRDAKVKDPAEDEEFKDDKLIVKPTPAPTPKRPISLGPVNGKATYLPVPVYSPAAQSIRASGQVNVEVTIDENGRVISAAAVSGHPLLRQNAVSAARISKFTPTTIGGVPVKVTGIIIYNFVPR